MPHSETRAGKIPALMFKRANSNRLDKKSISIATPHVLPCSTLRRVSKVPHSISGWFQSVPERIVSAANYQGIVRRMDPLLFVCQAASFQSMELERVEAVRRRQSSASSRLWPT